jgi:hypothetical protein
MAVFNNNSNRFNPTLQGFKNTYEVPTLDMDSLGDLGNTINKTKEEELKEVVDGLAQLNTLQDDITKIRVDNPMQQETIDRAVQRAGLTKDSFNLSREDFRNPNKIKGLERAVISLSNQPEMRQLVTDQTFADSYEQSALNIDDIGLRTKALQDLKKYKEGEISARELNVKEYTPVDYRSDIKTNLAELEETLTVKLNEDFANRGTAIFEEASGKVPEAVQFTLDKYKKDKQYINNIMNEQGFDDPQQAYDYIDQIGAAFSQRVVRKFVYNNTGGRGASSTASNRNLKLEKVDSLPPDLLEEHGLSIREFNRLGLMEYDSVNVIDGKLIATKGTNSIVVPTDVLDESQIRERLAGQGKEASEIDVIVSGIMSRRSGNPQGANTGTPTQGGNPSAMDLLNQDAQAAAQATTTPAQPAAQGTITPETTAAPSTQMQTQPTNQSVTESAAQVPERPLEVNEETGELVVNIEDTLPDTEEANKVSNSLRQRRALLETMKKEGESDSENDEEYAFREESRKNAIAKMEAAIKEDEIVANRIADRQGDIILEESFAQQAAKDKEIEQAKKQAEQQEINREAQGYQNVLIDNGRDSVLSGLDLTIKNNSSFGIPIKDKSGNTFTKVEANKSKTKFLIGEGEDSFQTDRAGLEKYIKEGIPHAPTQYQDEDTKELLKNLSPEARNIVTKLSMSDNYTYNADASVTPANQAAPVEEDTAPKKLPTKSSTPLQQLVKDRESGGGNYDALYGNIEQNNGEFKDMKVTEMTIGELKEFSKPRGEYGKKVLEMLRLKNPDRELTSTPMGAYQIVGTTLRDLQKSLDLPDDTVFTKEVQDDMFEYLVNRAVRQSEGLSPGEIMKRLRGTWEGLINVPDEELLEAINSSIN